MSEVIEISEEDIVFECPRCGKSMAIDRRGAGLTIACPDCQAYVRVPWAPGEAPSSVEEESDEGDSTVESLSDALKLSESKIAQLATDMSEMTAERRELESLRKKQATMLSGIQTEFQAIQAALDRINFILEEADEAR